MDLLKAITGKNPAEFEQAAYILVNTPDVNLYKNLVKQDDFLFDFVKSNVANRIQKACNNNNYKNLFKFFDYYSPSYDDIIAETLWQYGQLSLMPEIKNHLENGSDSAKAYATKYLKFVPIETSSEYIQQIRNFAYSDFEPLSINAIEILAKLNDNTFKENELSRLNSEDEFEKFDAVKHLVTFGAKDSLNKIIEIMKSSTLSENIACEIPFLVPIEELLKNDFDNGILILCHIVNAIPEIAHLSLVLDYNLLEIFENLYYENLTSTSAVLLRLAKEKFTSLTENDEYLYDTDKNTKDEIARINNLFKKINTRKLDSLLYDELYEDSDFVFFAVDYADGIEELETMLDSKNQTLLLKILSKLKEKNLLKPEHKLQALENISDTNLRQIIEVL